MNLSRLRARAPGITACLLLCMSVHGCATWRRQRVGVPEVLRARPERSLRVQADDGFTVLHQPWIDGDSLRGLVRTERIDASTRATLRLSTQTAVAISDVQSVEVRRFSGKRTALVSVGIVGGLLASLALAIALSDPWFTEPACFIVCPARP